MSDNVSVREFARLCGVAAPQVTRWIRGGRIEARAIEAPNRHGYEWWIPRQVAIEFLRGLLCKAEGQAGHLDESMRKLAG